MISSQNTDIYGSFRFWVEIDGLVTAGFSEVKGLQSEVETQEYHEGGVNGFVHRFPKKVTFPPLIFKRGFTYSTELWRWYAEVVEGKYKRRNGSIILKNDKGNETFRWNFYDSYPVKWIGPEFNALRSEVSIETLELVHNGLDIYKS